ncbi:unnamed protein product [Nippostrongylus brasiliensis]|uniref:Forkhead box protein O (inferred by orthology to a C. elegans protein) n=1 Tax=Nippostrongylus brasiliensis TaxID=27835 RepID=A0A158R2T2_NIPBR|nr:unnamed protein product [Nippostrongylus brasiliensis]
MRIQNEGAGKSSWWVINPDAKPGRNPRRVRASTLDTTSKATLSKKLKGARKRIHDIRGGLHSGVSSLAGSQASVMSHDIYGDEDAMQASFDSMFRSAFSRDVDLSRLTTGFAMRIDSCRGMMNGGVKQESKPIKTEPPAVQPPSYLELSSVRNQSQLQNPLLRSQLASVKFQTAGSQVVVVVVEDCVILSGQAQPNTIPSTTTTIVFLLLPDS